MKRTNKSVLGVTLLEVMLVLAIAAMIIVMSIRYYQSATASQQANQASGQVQAIASAFDNLALAKGNYTGITQDDISKVVGEANMFGPTGKAVVITESSDGVSYQVMIPVGPACDSVALRIKTNTKITAADCSGGDLTYTYNNTGT